MFMASTMKELLLSVHGIEMKFTTNSSELAHSVWALLRHFHRDTVAAQPMRMEFDAIERCEDVPVQISSSAKLLYSGSGLAIDPDRKTTWLCDIYSDNGLLIADFHGEGLVVIDGDSQSVRGYLVRPEAMAPDIRASFVHFAMTELLKRRGLYTFHATALEHKGQGVLIPGFSGRGKPPRSYPCCEQGIVTFPMITHFFGSAARVWRSSRIRSRSMLLITPYRSFQNCERPRHLCFMPVSPRAISMLRMYIRGH